jgi:hypothetical protein
MYFTIITFFHILYVLYFITVYMVLFLFNTVIYVFLLLCLCILIVCLCMATLTEIFPCFFRSVVRQMPGYNSQRRGTAGPLPNFCVVLCIVYFVSFCVLSVCICVLYYCQRVATQLQLNISYHIISNYTKS